MPTSIPHDREQGVEHQGYDGRALADAADQERFCFWSPMDDLLSRPLRHCARTFGEWTNDRPSAVGSHLEIDQAKAYFQRPIDLEHGRRVERSETPHKPLAVH